MLKNSLISYGLILSLVCGITLSHADEDTIKPKPMKMSASVDAGQIVKGYDVETSKEYKFQTIQKTNFWISQEAVINDHAEVKMGVFGTLFYVLPEVQGASHTRLPKFVMFPSNASLAYHFGEPTNPILDLQVGLFPLKYNPEASNLGEYLLRSGTYPGYLVTGGFNQVNSAGYLVQGMGLTLNLWDGKFKNNFLLPMERNFAPMHSISPTWITTLKSSPAFEFGAGVSCNHCISVKPSNEKNGIYENVSPDYMKWPGSIITEVHIQDTANKADTVPTFVHRDTTKFYTFQGIKLMGRFTFDPKAYIQSDLFNAPDLKIFAEIAVLGVKNYPYYFPDIKRRMPIMFGMNLPTFKALDLLSVQGEYYNSLFPNDISGLFEFQRPYWTIPNNNPATDGPGTKVWDDYVAKFSKWKWSVLAKKDLSKASRVWLQVANDHFRTSDYNIKPSTTAVTKGKSDWYYLFRLEMGIF